MWKGKYDPSGEAKMAEKLKDPSNPIRRVFDMLLESEKQMMRDGRMKLVDGNPVYSDEVKQMLAEREAQVHARCTQADPCGGVFNVRLKVTPAASGTPSRKLEVAPGSPRGKGEKEMKDSRAARISPCCSSTGGKVRRSS